jgi:hypothetical protein
MTKANMVALGDKMISTNAAFGTDDVKGNALLAKATLLTKAYFTAAWNYNKNKVKADQATADKQRADKARKLTADALKKAVTDTTVKAWMEAEAQKAYDAQVKVKAAKDATKLKADAAAALSTAMDVIAQKRGKFYIDAYAEAQKQTGVAVGAFNAATGLVTANGTATKSATAAETTAINNCKAVDYAAAQKQLGDINAKKTKDEALAKDVKTKYDALAKKPASTAAASPAGSSCAFGAEVAGVPAPRSVCADGLCCGAANKYMRDGTKLTVETCQKATDISYTFYPELKKGATVAPATEEWRFACISGAKNLAATATAALAAAYLMA